MEDPRPAVYLAGPTVFDEDPNATFELMKRICDKHGLRGRSPFDGQPGFESLSPGPDLLVRIVEADIDLMKEADCGVFCFDGFRRSPEMDPGTAFEIGYMCALGKPLAGWTRDSRLYPERVGDYFRDVFGQKLALEHGGTVPRSGVLRDADGILVHSEGCYQNAMTEIGVRFRGGHVHADGHWPTAFERAIADLAERVCLDGERGRMLAAL